MVVAVMIAVGGLVSGYGVSYAWRLRSRAMALVVVLWLAALAATGLAWAELPTGAAVLVSITTNGTISLLAARQARVLHMEADEVRDDAERRDTLETAAGTLLAASVLDAAVAFLSLVLGYLMGH